MVFACKIDRTIPFTALNLLISKQKPALFPTVESNNVTVSKVAILISHESIALTQSPSKVPVQVNPVAALAVSSL